MTKSRRLSGAVLFRVIATGRWRDLSKRIDQKPKTVWSCTFSGHRSGSLERLFAKYRPKAGSCLELYFFGLSQRATWGASRSVWKGSRRLSGRNVFSGYISKGWSGFSQRISPKLEAAWPERLFRAQFRRLVGLFAGYRPKAESCLAGIFFRGTFPKAGVAFRRGSPQSWRRPDLNVFSEHNSEGWWDFSQGIDPKPKAVWSCTFSGHRSGSLGEPRGRWEKAAGSGRVLKLFQVYLPMIFVISCYLFPAYFTLSFSIHFIQTLTES